MHAAYVFLILYAQRWPALGLAEVGEFDEMPQNHKPTD